MKKGIIYTAYNTTSGKYYVGQTVNSLKRRKYEHYALSKKEDYTYHFMRALRFYNEDEWIWSITEEVPVDKLDERETYWIRTYDSFENGYNSNWGGQEAVKPSAIHSLYHPDYGVVEGELSFFMVEYGFFHNTISLLKSKTCRMKSYKGWVLSEHKDDYYSFLNRKPRKAEKYSLYHPDFGVVTDTIKGFKKISESTSLHSLATKKINSSKGWVRAEDKDRYKEVCGIMTLKSDEGDVVEGTPTELSKRYGKPSKEAFRQVLVGQRSKIKINNRWYYSIK